MQPTHNERDVGAVASSRFFGVDLALPEGKPVEPRVALVVAVEAEPASHLTAPVPRRSASRTHCSSGRPLTPRSVWKSRQDSA